MLGVSFEVNMFSKTVHIEEIKGMSGATHTGSLPLPHPASGLVATTAN